MMKIMIMVMKMRLRLMNKDEFYERVVRMLAKGCANGGKTDDCEEKTKLGNLSMRKVDRVFADNDDNHDKGMMKIKMTTMTKVKQLERKAVLGTVQ